MDFYETLAPHYDFFFPPNPATMEFIKRTKPEGSRRAYDAGCATGSAALDLARAGWSVLGVDLCAPMIDLARKKADSLRLDTVRFECGDMTEERFIGEGNPWSLVLCLGNTLPHLGADSMLRFFQSIKRRMEPEGLFVIQTLNYAHPEIVAGFVFPELEADQAILRRTYTARSDGGLWFDTEILEGGRIHEDRTVLTPVTPGTQRLFLERAGFSDIGFAGSWTSPAFDQEKDRYLITTARV